MTDPQTGDPRMNESGRVTVRWFEQSHFEIRTAEGTRIHFDPYLSRTIKPENFIYPRPVIEPMDARADLVLLTHDHRDHTDPDTLVPMAKANPAMTIIGSAESCSRCEKAGIDRARLTRIAAGERMQVGDVSIEAVYAEDTSDADFTTHLGFVIGLSGGRIYMTGDTRTGISAYLDRIESLRGLGPELLIVPINTGYNNPGPAGAREIVELTEPELIVPCHFGCFKNNTIDPDEFLRVLSPDYRERTRVLGRGATLVLN